MSSPHHRARLSGDFGSLLIVEPRERVPLPVEPLSALGFRRIAVAHDWAAARARVADGFDTLLLEACFADGSDCRELLPDIWRLSDPPIAIAMSDRAPRALIAELMLSGVEGYLERPFEPAQLSELVVTLRDDVQRCRRAALPLVGRVGLKEAQWYLRGLMNREALARARGNQRVAASILQVDRRYVARLASEFRGPAFAPVGGDA